MLHKLSARARIRDFEEGGAKSSDGKDDVKDDVVKLAVAHNLASRYRRGRRARRVRNVKTS